MTSELEVIHNKNELAEVTDVNSLDELQKLKIAAQILGYKELPPTIEEFLDSGYYLSKETTKGLFPYWREKLRMIFPNPIEVRYPILVLTGCIGSGKSTFAKLCALYTLCKLDHLKDPRKSLGIMPGKNLVFVFNHRSIDLAKKEFVDPLKEWMDSSPYFSGGMLHGSLSDIGVEFKTDRSIGMTPSYIGTDVIFGNLSEINFVNPKVARNRIDTITKRLSSRFQMYINYFCMVILDSSAQGDGSVVDEFMADNPFQDMTLTLRMSRWEVRSHQNFYGTKGWFTVYSGDSTHAPFILRDDSKIDPELDPDRFIKVPEECRSDFELNIITALQDLAGISTSGTDAFFSNPDPIIKCATLPKLTDDIIKVNFDDKKDDIMLYVQRAVDTIPRDRIIYIHVDLGVSNDNCGVAISYMDHYETFGVDSGWNNSEKAVRMPYIVTPVAFAINRYEGQQTSIWHVEQFIMELSKHFEIGVCEFDQYQSTQAIQDLVREGINARRNSVFRTDEAAVTFKNLVLNNCTKYPYNELLVAELAALKRVGNKVEPGHRGEAGENSHCDVAESVIGSTYACYCDADNAIQISSVAKIKKQNEILTELINKGNEIQNALTKIY